MKAYVNSVGIFAKGISSWAEALPMLCGQAELADSHQVLPKPRSTSPRELRRLTAAARLVFYVAFEAMHDAQLPADEYMSVFASALGNTDVFNETATTLAKSERSISPTKFSHSLLNAAAGCWSIATKAMNRSISLSAGEYTAGVGLIEALVNMRKQPMLLVIYDIATQEPLKLSCPAEHDFAVALSLSSQRMETSIACIEMSETDQAVAHDDTNDLFSSGQLFTTTFPLLQAIAAKESSQVIMACSSQLNYCFTVTPCQ
jgi:3-oxoacyl-(acyl-carrier-protein) synthase